MRLSEVLSEIEVLETAGDPAIDIRSVETDSRKVTPGALFVCLEGARQDGHSFAAAAVAAGAGAVACSRPVVLPDGVARVLVPDTLRTLSPLAAAVYGHPCRHLQLIGVTGTNGKTTTTHLVESILKTAGCRTGLIGTVGYRIGERELPAPFTTPLAHSLHAILRQMVDAGVEVVVMEVSSHALSLSRVDDCSFTAAGFTNLSQDHLDFHGTMEEYYHAKRRLFQLLDQPGGVPVINIDDPYGGRLAAECGDRPLLLTVSSDPACRPVLGASDVQAGPDQTSFTLNSPAGIRRVSLRLKGHFNVLNSLVAAGAASALDVPLDHIKTGLEAVRGVPGRFESFRAGGVTVIVDYAHTPAGLENVLSAVRKLTPGRIITVFGCGGDRDRTKRPRMGAIGARLSDLIVVTNDNPRTEDPAGIIEDIMQGVAEQPGSGGRTEIEPDRAAAIEKAIGAARPGDTVVVAGKGHEDYQIFGDRTIHFEDREVVRSALALEK